MNTVRLSFPSFITGLFCLFLLTTSQQALTKVTEELKLSSPDGAIELAVQVKKDISYSVAVDGKTVLMPSRLSMRLEAYEVGINADRWASDHKRVNRTIKNGEKLTIKMAPAGEWTARLTPR